MGVYIGLALFVIVTIAAIMGGTWIILIFSLPATILLAYASFGGFDNKEK
tara:strand:- start:1189 stop:1338 length:150 start_codon:yes stop_codon:yes gene_type:complete